MLFLKKLAWMGILSLGYYEKHKIDISDGTPSHLRLFLEGMTETKIWVASYR